MKSLIAKKRWLIENNIIKKDNFKGNCSILFGAYQTKYSLNWDGLHYNPRFIPSLICQRKRKVKGCKDCIRFNEDCKEREVISNGKVKDDNLY